MPENLNLGNYVLTQIKQKIIKVLNIGFNGSLQQQQFNFFIENLKL